MHSERERERERNTPQFLSNVFAVEGSSPEDIR
jgi:hypothetical protein